MIALGKKADLPDQSVLQRFELSWGDYDLSTGRPTKMPALYGEEKLIAGADRAIDELLYLCESVEDMQSLWHDYSRGLALHMYWYKAKITIISPENN